jgi:hypothetical protein
MLCEETSRAYHARDLVDPRAILDTVVNILMVTLFRINVVKFNSMLPGGNKVGGDEGYEFTTYCCVQD